MNVGNRGWSMPRLESNFGFHQKNEPSIQNKSIANRQQKQKRNKFEMVHLVLFCCHFIIIEHKKMRNERKKTKTQKKKKRIRNNAT